MEATHIPHYATPYTPLSGEQCYSVTGPKGHYLITPQHWLPLEQPRYEVWRADQISNHASGVTLENAFIRAAHAAGVEVN